jgi:Protein of unknown function (DUF4013)
VNSAGDAFAFPFRSPGWLGTIVLQGLILIIPIIGQIALAGWLLVTLDNLRDGRQELAPAGFHLSRGIRLFGVQFIYGVVLSIIPAILEGIGSAMQQSNGSGVALLTLGYLLNLVAVLLLAFLFPALILITHEQGFAAAMNVGAVWRLATANVGNSAAAGALIIVAHIIGGLGFILCFVGVLFTTAYAYAVTAGVVDWYRRVQTQPAQVGPSPAA